jgi:hypothetical protein
MALAALLALAATATAPAPVPAQAAFDRLKALTGTWRPADKPNSPLRIRFSLTAGGTVLVESWERAGQPHSLTLYHRDGARLIATHYCPQGNQPRLALSTSDPAHPARLRFAYRDATDLDAGESHLHDLAFDLTDPNRPVRREIYRQGYKDDLSSLTLVRVDD